MITRTADHTIIAKTTTNAIVSAFHTALMDPIISTTA
jgi:hypothetical protein